MSENYDELFWLIFPLLGILISVLYDIQQKTMAGIFDFVLDKHENFVQSLQRTEANMLKQNAEFKERYEHEFKVAQLLKSKLEYNSIETKRSRSKVDGLEYMMDALADQKLVIDLADPEDEPLILTGE